MNVSKDCSRLLQAITIGFIAGSRAATALVVTSVVLSRGRKPTSKILAAIADKKGVRLLAGLALPELVLDKMPFVGNRTAAGGVAGRAVSGALSGAAVFKAAAKPALPGAVAGAATAVAATYGLFYARRELGKKTGIKDAWIGLAEDALIIGLGAWMVRKSS